MKRTVPIIIIVGLLAGAAGVWAWRSHRQGRSAATAQGAAAGGSTTTAAGEGRAVPVLAATVARRDMPIYLDGLGSVVAFKTVTVKSQVDGRLDKVLFREGQEVHRGDLLAQIDPRPFEILLHSAEAALARDRATVRNNHVNLERYRTLAKQNLIQQQTVDDQQAMVDQGEAVTRADQAQIESARLQLDYARITSPIDGRTGVRLVDPGNLVRASDATGLVVITQLDPIAVLFTLPEDNLPEISQQMAERTLTAEARSRDGKTDLGTGEVALVDNQINQATGTIRIKAIFNNPNRTLWPNQFVKIRLLLRTRKDAVVVPSSVIQRGPQGTFAYVIDQSGPDKKASLRPVTIEATEGNFTLIKSGLKPGEQVVADGQYQLKPGSRLAVRPPEGQRGRLGGTP